MKDNVILIGMPGSGKSTVGVILAKTLGFDFIDTDLIISKNEGMKLQKIIDKKGLQSFLDSEEVAVCGLKCEKTVIATGGSVICRQRSMEYLKELGTIVYLNVPYSEIERRIKNIKTRGIAFEEGETLCDIFRKRTPLYQKYADVTIDIKPFSDMESAVEGILNKISI